MTSRLVLLLIVSLFLGAASEDIVLRGGLPFAPGNYLSPGMMYKDDSHTYYFNATSSGPDDMFDVDLILEVLDGDVDLEVKGPVKDPSGQERRQPTIREKSIHHTGEDIVFLSRFQLSEAEPGLFVATIHGYGEENYYRFTIEKAYTERAPPAEEQEALEDFYNKCCSWDGACRTLSKAVKAAAGDEMENFCHLRDQGCDKSGHITILTIPAEDVECELPSSLSKLTRLQRLDLEDNFVFGDAQDVMEVIKDIPLISLHLGRNEIEGVVPCLPTNGALIDNLSYLDMSFNWIEGPLQSCFFDSQYLEVVTLEGNLVHGEFPSLVPYSQKLYHVDLSWQGQDGMFLTGSIPDLRPWPKLTYLNLAENHISGTFPQLPPLLRILYLDENEITGPIPSNFASWADLTVMSLQHNKFNGPLPVSLPPSLKDLNLAENLFTGAIPVSRWFGTGVESSNLREIQLGGNKLEGPLPAELAKIPELWALNLTDNQITGTMENFVAALPANNEFVQFEAAFNKLTGPLPEDASKFAMLLGEDYDPEADMRRLPSFDVAYNQLTGPFPISILLDASDEWHNLFFDISNNQFTCPTHHLNLPEDVEDDVLESKCLDRRGRTVELGDDQKKHAAQAMNRAVQAASPDVADAFPLLTARKFQVPGSSKP
mmetsp:Transcript_8557/g.24553  ORF Transcript_8557/g.24553 Transcript_8557/m.24553 type:complete len:656 (-) Transcript_8557:202-2169(-)|eukprot:CAMPEP_0117666158 /NCGR_PEP_ID=MMETSP0804-20121206/10216_1 /TAXON_ID=1074897 /ORGANISM="Tetraselmis astigmatica, Strain CCMP880" /LENGTH=655 /DNA_ID=CAMNT_0005473663 /DNA_START=130 /DNA_END=2097 /DNA_ORIENTATION=-